MAAKKYRVLSPLKHDKKHYEPGSTVELEDEHVAPLLATKTIEDPSETKAKDKDKK